MHPALSVIFLTTLIGTGQGLFLALVMAQIYAALGAVTPPDAHLYATGSLLSLVLLGLGLFASFFHLGHPERAWRAASQWRTSWLSREVIALPAFMGLVFVYGVLHHLNWDPLVFGTAALPQGRLTMVVGMLGVVVCFTLFLCTGMIYACLKFLQEWHTPLTPINYTLLGMSSGFTLATAFTAGQNNELTSLFGTWAVILTLAALLTRGASLLRNQRIKYRSTLRTAIGVRHRHIEQKAMGAMGGVFNTREFFHGASALFFKSIKWVFLILVFPVPVVALLLGLSNGAAALLTFAFVVQYIGLLAERWFFFAQAKHPQNLYYQTI